MKSTRPFQMAKWHEAGHSRVKEFENVEAFVTDMGTGKAFEAPAVVKTFPELGKDLSSVFNGWHDKFKKHCAEKNVTSGFASEF